MLLSIFKPLFRFVRHSRDIFKKPPSANVEEEGHTTPTARPSEGKVNVFVMVEDIFPYKLGGIRNYQADQAHLNLLLPQDRVYIDVYKSLLEGISARNERRVADLVERSLVKPLLGGSVRYNLIHKSSPLSILNNQFCIGIGASMRRQAGAKFVKQNTPDNLVTLYSPQTFNPSQYSLIDGIPVLLSVHTTVISKARLVRPEDEEEQEQEAHSVTFEYESSFHMSDMMAMMKMLPSMKSKQDVEPLKNILYKQKKPWRVGNIDGFLPSRYQ